MDPRRLFQSYSGGDLFSQGVAPQVSSARTAFTTVFGMGTGGTPSLRPPESGASLAAFGDRALGIEYLRCAKSVVVVAARERRSASLTALPRLSSFVALTTESVNVADIGQSDLLTFFSYGTASSCGTLHCLAFPLLFLQLLAASFRSSWRWEEMRVE